MRLVKHVLFFAGFLLCAAMGALICWGLLTLITSETTLRPATEGFLVLGATGLGLAGGGLIGLSLLHD